ncbi:MAG: flagellar biosynthesis regulatory protein FlaF [Rhodospirillaceae bacterium]|nr:MAG: flagellar biosynthesis regulatory protein FlaF [Rhodospirillaceae bacterium]
MSRDKIAAYQQQQKRNLSPREVEAMAFTKAALMLEDAKKHIDNITEYSKALRFNHLLWTIIQADLTDPENQLPPEIKANVMSLSIFVDKQTTKALRSTTVNDLDVLININRNLAAGLRSTPETAAAGAPAAPSTAGSP